MFIGLYLLALAGSAACFGVFVHQVLAEQGYAAGFAASAWLTTGVACAYIAAQFTFMGLLGLVKPAKGGKVAAAEMLSLAAAAILIPYLAGVEIPWPDPLLERAAPLVFLGLFASLHVALKLVSFFAALQSEPTSHAYGLVWLGLALAAAGVSYTSSTRWMSELDAARLRAPEESEVRRVGTVYSLARVMPEGALAEMPIDWEPGQSLALRWAPLAGDDAPAPTRAYVTVSMQGDYAKDYRRRVDLNEDGWAHLRVPALEIPPGLRSCSVYWTPTQEPGWRRVTGFRPLRTGGRSVLLSGPYVHSERDSHDGPNVVMVLIDGLGPEHIVRGGAADGPTPGLDRFAFTSVDFRRAYTVAPDSPAAAATLLTGLNPLRHGYLGAHAGPLPDEALLLGEMLRRRGYATAAFTEGEGLDTLDFGYGLERGFADFDPVFAERAAPAPEGPPEAEDAATLFEPLAPDLDEEAEDAKATASEPEPEAAPEVPLPGDPVGSAATLDRARGWLDLHAPTQFLLFIRLTELRRAVEHGWSADGVAGESEEASASPEAAFHASLARIDRHLGAFVKHIRDFDTGSNTLVVVTSPFAYAFDQREDTPRVGLADENLAVPLYIWAQWIPRGERDDEVSLEDVLPALLGQLDLTAPSGLDGLDCLAGPVGGQPISVGGDPLVMTMRNPRWRLYWNTGRTAFDAAQRMPEQDPVLLEIRGRGGPVDATQRFPDTAALWLQRLRARLDEHDQIWLR